MPDDIAQRAQALAMWIMARGGDLSEAEIANAIAEQMHSLLEAHACNRGLEAVREKLRGMTLDERKLAAEMAQATMAAYAKRSLGAIPPFWVYEVCAKLVVEKLKAP